MQSRGTLRLMMGGTLAAMAATAALVAGCTAGEDENLVPAGAVYVEHYQIGAATVQASASAIFFRDFTSADPADDITVNPFLDIPIGECVDVFAAGNPTYTVVDAGDLSLTGALTLMMSYSNGAAYPYSASIPPATFPFTQFVSAEVSGSADVDAASWPNGLATGDNLTFTAPAGINTNSLTIPGTAALDLTYDSVSSEIMMAIFVNGANGKQCRLDPGSGGSTTFSVPVDIIAAIPATGQVLIYSYNQREETLTVGGVSSKVGLFGTNYKITNYTKS